MVVRRCWAGSVVLALMVLAGLPASAAGAAAASGGSSAAGGNADQPGKQQGGKQRAPHFRNHRNKNRPEDQPRNIDVEGTIATITSNEMSVVSEKDKQSWFVVLAPHAKVQTTGSAEPSFLRAGLEIELSAEVGEDGIVKEKVSSLKIVSPSPETHQPSKPAAKGADAAGKKPASIGGARPAKDSSSSATRLVGRISGVRDEKIILHADHRVVQFEVDSSAQIDIDMSNAALAQSGDKVSVRGMAAAGKPLIMAENVKITMIEPRTGKKKHVPAPPEKTEKRASAQ